MFLFVVHGNWSNWSEPSNCSVACGTGITTRIRACDNPAPQNGGDLCPGSDREQQECDSGVPCPGKRFRTDPLDRRNRNA